VRSKSKSSPGADPRAPIRSAMKAAIAATASTSDTRRMRSSSFQMPVSTPIQ
jgi:hypothetical protein